MIRGSNCVYFFRQNAVSIEKKVSGVNGKIRMYKKGKIKMYSFSVSGKPQVPLFDG